MKPKSITFDRVFEKHWLKYLRGLTEKQKEHLRERLAVFKEDVFDKRLKTHRLKGNLKEYYAFSVSYSDRIVFSKLHNIFCDLWQKIIWLTHYPVYQGRILEDDSVYFIEIGGHDVCY